MVSRRLAAGRGAQIRDEAAIACAKIAELCDVVVVDGSDLRGAMIVANFFDGPGCR